LLSNNLAQLLRGMFDLSFVGASSFLQRMLGQSHIEQLYKFKPQRSNTDTVL
jgi:hypothetical protein